MARRKNRNRVLALLFVFAMVLSLFANVPTTAEAAGQDAQGTSPTAIAGTDALWQVDGTTLIISGTGVLDSYSDGTKAPWYSSYHDAITTVQIGYGITELGSRDFSLENVTTVYLPSTVTKIADDAFGKAGSSKSVQSATVYYCTLGDGVDTASAYGADSLTWTKIKHQYWENGVCGLCNKTGERSGTIESVKISWTYKDGVLTISGKGALPDYDTLKEAKRALGWYEISEDITKIVIEEGITSIGSRALVLENVTKIVLADSVKSVDAKAFSSTGTNGVQSGVTITGASKGVLDDVVFAGSASDETAEAEEASNEAETSGAEADTAVQTAEVSVEESDVTETADEKDRTETSSEQETVEGAPAVEENAAAAETGTLPDSESTEAASTEEKEPAVEENTDEPGEPSEEDASDITAETGVESSDEENTETVAETPEDSEEISDEEAPEDADALTGEEDADALTGEDNEAEETDGNSTADTNSANTGSRPKKSSKTTVQTVDVLGVTFTKDSDVNGYSVSSGTNGSSVKVKKDYSATITDGTVSDVEVYGKLTIKGGTFNGDIYVATDGTLNIEGGTFNGTIYTGSGSVLYVYTLGNSVTFGSDSMIDLSEGENLTIFSAQPVPLKIRGYSVNIVCDVFYNFNYYRRSSDGQLCYEFNFNADESALPKSMQEEAAKHDGWKVVYGGYSVKTPNGITQYDGVGYGEFPLTSDVTLYANYYYYSENKDFGFGTTYDEYYVYLTLLDAINSCINKGESIDVIAYQDNGDTGLDANTTVSGDVTLETNGHSLTIDNGTFNGNITVELGGTLTIKGGTFNGDIVMGAGSKLYIGNWDERNNNNIVFGSQSTIRLDTTVKANMVLNKPVPVKIGDQTINVVSDVPYRLYPLGDGDVVFSADDVPKSVQAVAVKYGGEAVYYGYTVETSTSTQLVDMENDAKKFSLRGITGDITIYANFRYTSACTGFGFGTAYDNYVYPTLLSAINYCIRNNTNIDVLVFQDNGDTGLDANTTVSGDVTLRTRGHSLTIDNGTFNGDITVTGSGTLTINGGTFNGNISSDYEGKLTITCGTFNGDIVIVPNSTLSIGKWSERFDDKIVFGSASTIKLYKNVNEAVIVINASVPVKIGDYTINVVSELPYELDYTCGYVYFGAKDVPESVQNEADEYGCTAVYDGYTVETSEGRTSYNDSAGFKPTTDATIYPDYCYKSDRTDFGFKTPYESGKVYPTLLSAINSCIKNKKDIDVIVCQDDGDSGLGDNTKVSDAVTLETNGHSLTIDNGTFSGDITVKGGGNLTISGGIFDGDKINITGGTATVDSGSFKNAEIVLDAVENASVSANLNGGTFTDATITASGTSMKCGEGFNNVQIKLDRTEDTLTINGNTAGVYHFREIEVGSGVGNVEVTNLGIGKFTVKGEFTGKVIINNKNNFQYGSDEVLINGGSVEFNGGYYSSLVKLDTSTSQGDVNVTFTQGVFGGVATGIVAEDRKLNYTFKNGNFYGVDVYFDSMTIEGGNFYINGETAVGLVLTANTPSAVLNISNGTFSDIEIAEALGNLTISGGTFDGDKINITGGTATVDSGSFKNAEIVLTADASASVSADFNGGTFTDATITASGTSMKCGEDFNKVQIKLDRTEDTLTINGNTVGFYHFSEIEVGSGVGNVEVTNLGIGKFTVKGEFTGKVIINNKNNLLYGSNEVLINGGSVEFNGGGYTSVTMDNSSGNVNVTFNKGSFAKVASNRGAKDRELNYMFNGGTFNEFSILYFDSMTVTKGDFHNCDLLTLFANNSSAELNIRGGDFSGVTINEDSGKMTISDGTFDGTEFNVSDATATFKNAACGSATINVYRISNTDAGVTLNGGTYGSVKMNEGASLTVKEGTTIGKLCAANGENTIPVILDSKQINLVSAIQPISLKTDSSMNVSVTAGAGTCKGWYLGTGVKDGDADNLKLCNRATYMFAVSACHAGDNYYAYYADDTGTAATDQMTLTTSQKAGSDSTIHFVLERSIPDAYKVTLVGIKFSTNKLIQADLTEKLSTDKNQDLTTAEKSLSADEITEKMWFGTGETTTSCDYSQEKPEGIANDITAYLNLKVGTSNTEAPVYALGYATVSDSLGQTYTLYTGLYVLTYKNAADEQTAK